MNHHTPRILTIASGKGGVGKTSFTLNLATVLASQGETVLVVDGDTGLANADIQLNIKPVADLADALEGRKPLAEIITPTPHGFHFIAGRSGHLGLSALPLPTLTTWLNDLRALGQTYSTILVDAAAGITPQTLLMCAQSQTTVVLTTPDPASLTDAYALIKVLWQQHHTLNARVVVNQATAREATHVHTRLTTAITNFLKLTPPPLVGHIPTCKYWSQAVRNHELTAHTFPHSPAITALRELAPRLLTP
jgi:flagellar biosynthesis protein FlhG